MSTLQGCCIDAKRNKRWEVLRNKKENAIQMFRHLMNDSAVQSLDKLLFWITDSRIPKSMCPLLDFSSLSHAITVLTKAVGTCVCVCARACTRTCTHTHTLWLLGIVKQHRAPFLVDPILRLRLHRTDLKDHSRCAKRINYQRDPGHTRTPQGIITSTCTEI